ncbi:hypothetical protein HAV15_010702 [Penicillium sp. str. |nr:hypothetical protein HAV15_010702 [Penicillium sp. str. \
MFLVALDMSIITTAIPTITARFHSEGQMGWYGSAFFLCLASFQSFWGKAYKYFPIKIAFLTAIGVFELGSLVAALSPNSPALIIGRAIQGIGGAGVTGGCYTVLAFITRPKNLQAVFGLTSGVFSLSSVLGPILSGMPPHSRVAHATLKELPFLFDIPGIALTVCALVYLVLVLEDGGVTKPWNSKYCIGLLIGFSLIVILLIVLEWKQGEGAMIVPRIIKRRTVLVLALFNLTAQGSGFARIYNLPIYFQAAQGQSPSESGIRTLPTVLTTSIFSFAGSLAIGKVGYYQPFLMLGSMFVTIGSAMIYTLEPNSGSGKYIGYQVLASIGSGLIIQLKVIVAQAISKRVDMSVTVGSVLFFQFIGGTVGVAASTNIMNNVLISSLPADGRISASDVLSAGSTGLAKMFPNPADLKIVVSAYMKGLKAAWIWSIALAGVSFLVSLAAERKSVRLDHVKKRTEKKAAEEAATA